MKLPALPPSWKVFAFTFNLICGLALSQILGACMEKQAYKIWHEIVTICTMWALAFIMVNVGYEFTVDKDALSEYVWDYLIAMTAAGFPWVFVAVWFLLTLNVKFAEAFLVARFAAPTSAGILFSMLAGAGLRETWLYQKARILAIFDDLDTILLMIPLKILMIGFKWELLVVIAIMFILLVIAWRKLHAWKLPHSWPWTLVYAAVVTTFCHLVHHVTAHYIDMHAIHIEVLLPAFVVGCVIDTPCAREELQIQRQRTSSLRLARLSQTSLADMKDGDLAFIRVNSVKSQTGANELRDPAKYVDDRPQQPWCDSKDNLRAAGAAGNTDRALSVSVLTETVPPAFVPDDDGMVTCIIKTVSKSNVHDTELTTMIAVQTQDGESHKGSSKEHAASPIQDTAVTSHIVMKPPGDSAPLFPRMEHDSIVGREPKTRIPSGYEPDAEPGPAMGRTCSKISTMSKRSITSVTSKSSRCSRHGLDMHDEWEHYVQTSVSMVFMVLVGLSMPSLVGKNAGENDSDLGPGVIALHILMVSILMILGKMFPSVCYRDEAKSKVRFALCLGMCPRGEVGASIIVISLELGAKGSAIIIAMCALVINLVMSGGFIGLVKVLLQSCKADEITSPSNQAQKPASSELKAMDV